MGIHKGTVLLASLQQQGKRSELLGTGVEVYARQVVAEDVFHRLAAAVALLHVALVEQVETFVQDMSRTAGKVGAGQFVDVVEAEDGCFRCRLFRFYEVCHRLFEFRVGIVVQIDAPHGVLHHILHNPVGREYLCGGRNLVRLELSLLGKHLVFLLGDIDW